MSHLIIETGATVNISPGSTLTASLSITNNGDIHLKSDATGTGGLIYNETSNPITATVERYLSGLQYHYVSSPLNAAPVSCYNINAYGFTNTNFYSYDQSNTSSDWLDGWTLVSTGNLGIGAGYALYSTESHTHSLSGGTLNNGNIQVAVNNSANGDPSNGWTIIGNPYPSDIDAIAFINENTALLDGDAIYYWDDDNSEGLNYETNDYATYNLLGGASASVNGGIPNTSIGLGQAFFIKATGNGNITFTNAMKSETQAVFFKSMETDAKESDVSRTWFNLTNDTGDANQILIGFTDKATIGMDEGYDAEKLKGNQRISFYSLYNSKELAIQALPPIEQSTEVMLGIDANVAANYTISLAQTDNLDVLMDIYLIDKQTGKITDMQHDAYTFKAEGKITNRFAVKFVKKPLQYTRWLGNENDLFYDQDKWDNGLPNKESTVVIPTGKKALLNGVLLCHDVIIEPGATFKFNSSESYIDTEQDIVIQWNQNTAGNFIDYGSAAIQGVMQSHLTNNISYMSTPFQNTIAGNWLSSTDSTDLFLHNELQNNFMPVTDASWDLYSGTGFVLNKQGQLPKKYNKRGLFNTGLQTIYLNSGYQLVGNPYPAYIDWGTGDNATGWTNTDQIHASMWLNRNTTDEPNSGNYAVYNRKSGIGVNGASRIIAPMQAFWVYAPNQADISINNEAKVTPGDVEEQQIVESYISLKTECEGYSDETVVGVLPASDYGFDIYDSYKMFSRDSNYPQLFTLTSTDEKEVAINIIPEQWTLDTKIPLGFKSDKGGTHTITLKAFAGNNQEFLVVLEDKELNNSVILSQQKSYTFSSGITKNTSRFSIGFIKETSVLSNPKQKIQIYAANRTLYVLSDDRLTDYDIKIYDLCGRQVFQSLRLTKKQIELPSTVASGIFIIQIQNNKNVFNKKIFIK